MLRHLTVSTLILVAALTTASAQTAPPPPVPVKLRLLAFTPEMKVAEVYIHDPLAPDVPAVATEIKSYLNDESSTISLTSRKASFSLKKDAASLTRDGELIGEVNLPANVNSAICVFLPGKADAKARYLVMPIDDRAASFPAGSLRVTNLSPLPVQIRLENKPYDFKPGQELVITDPPVRAGNQSGMRTLVFKENKWQPVSSGLWPHPGAGRKLMILFANPTNGNIQMNAYDDVPPR